MKLKQTPGSKFNNAAIVGGSLMNCLWMLTPAEAQKALANEPRPHFANDGQVGLPCFCQHPAEGRQEEEMQESSSHSTEALREKKIRGKERDGTVGDIHKKVKQ